ncbi:MAG: alpha/beta hydrolase [Chloroflexi bacterium]|nr:alpha/beta hydrolase [Chloroflexota bacterium]
MKKLFVAPLFYLTILATAVWLLLALTGCSSAEPTPVVVAPVVENTAVAPESAPAATTAPAAANVMPQRGAAGSSTTFASVAPTMADLAYADLSSTQKLDLYIPTSGDGPFPVVFMVHGGGFMFGDKADGAGLTGVDQLLEAGYAVASINYRLSGEAIYPAQIYDAKTAVRFLRANAAQYNLDPEKFGAWGASGGGQHCLFAGHNLRCRRIRRGGTGLR